MAVANEKGRAGRRSAISPWSIPSGGWKAVLLRSWREAGEDNISLIASGVAFCAVLAMVPMLGAIVLLYGLVATPHTVSESVHTMMSMMPTDAARLIGEQLDNVVKTSDGKKGVGLLIAIAIALYGVMKGASAVITALNIAYEEQESRSSLRRYLVAFAMAGGGVAIAIFAVMATAAMTALEKLIPDAPAAVLILGKIVSYGLLTAIAAGLAAMVYRYGPDRRNAQWLWLTPGSLFASLSWLIITIGFGFYVANLGSYDATYGSLGAAIVLLTWLYLSSYVLLLGAELNCELERQTIRDTTEGPERPLGARGAYAADTVAEADDRPSPSMDGLSVAASPVGTSLSRRKRKHPSAVKHFLMTRLTARIIRAAGFDQSGAASSTLASGGLALLRRPRRRALGGALLVAAGSLTVVSSLAASRRRDVDQPDKEV